MPKMVKLEINPNWLRSKDKPTSDEKSAFAAASKAIKVAGKDVFDYISARENIKRSGGMYQIVVEEARTPVQGMATLEDMPIDELKLMLLRTGKTIQKKTMKKSDMIAMIREWQTSIVVEEEIEVEQSS